MAGKPIKVKGVVFDHSKGTTERKDIYCIPTDDESGKFLSVIDGNRQIVIEFDPIDKFFHRRFENDT